MAAGITHSLPGKGKHAWECTAWLGSPGMLKGKKCQLMPETLDLTKCLE